MHMTTGNCTGQLNFNSITPDRVMKLISLPKYFFKKMIWLVLCIIMYYVNT